VLTAITKEQAATVATRTIHDYGTEVIQTDSKKRIDLFPHPVANGDSYYKTPVELFNSFEKTAPNLSVK
jgi:hypothetical protein